MIDEEMTNYYRARAPEYEQIYYRDNRDRQAEIAVDRERLTQLVRGKRVLELACGTGYWTKVMSESASSITATDISPEMIVEAKKKSFGCSVNLIQADLKNLPVMPHSFDIVALGFWFSHHPRQEYEKLFMTISDQLSPEGCIWMVDNNPPAESGENRIRVDEFGNAYKSRKLENGEQHVILKNYFTKEELLELFSADFAVNRLDFSQYYWSVELEVRS